MTSLGWTPVHCEWCPSKNGNFGHTQAWGGDGVKTQGEDAADKVRREAWNRPYPCSPQKEPTLETSRVFRPPEL